MSALPAPIIAAIRDRRTSLGLTQVEAAVAGAVSPATWTAVEKGRSEGSNLVRVSMCKALGWTGDSIDRLLRGETAIIVDRPDPDTDDEGAALKVLTEAVERLTEKVDRQGALIDRLVEAELGRRRQ